MIAQPFALPSSLSLSLSLLSFSLSLTFSLSHFLFLFPPLFLSVLVTLLDSLPSLCLRMAMIPGTAYAPFYALLFTGTWLLSTRVAILTVRHCMRVYTHVPVLECVHANASAHIRRIMGRLLTLNTVNNSQWRRTICNTGSPSFATRSSLLLS